MPSLFLSEIDLAFLHSTDAPVSSKDQSSLPLHLVSFAGTKDNSRRQGKSELAQLWKDMKRDTVSINGRVLKGELGPEAIVGALTRCILAQARYMTLGERFHASKWLACAHSLFQPRELSVVEVAMYGNCARVSSCGALP